MGDLFHPSGIQEGMRMSVTAKRAPVVLEPASQAFVEDDRSPGAHYPIAIEQGYATAPWIAREGAANQLDPERIAVAGRPPHSLTSRLEER